MHDTIMLSCYVIAAGTPLICYLIGVAMRPFFPHHPITGHLRTRHLATRLFRHTPGRLCNKLVLMWLLTIPLHLEYVGTLSCNLSLIACFLASVFHKVVWQHMQGVIWSLVTRLMQIYCRIFLWKNFENALRFDGIMVMKLCAVFLVWCVPTLYIPFSA